MTEMINWLTIEGSEIRSACGKTMRNVVLALERPRLRAASVCPRGHSLNAAAEDLCKIRARIQAERDDARHIRRKPETGHRAVCNIRKERPDDLRQPEIHHQRLHQHRRPADNPDIDGRDAAAELVFRQLEQAGKKTDHDAKQDRNDRYFDCYLDTPQ